MALSDTSIIGDLDTLKPWLRLPLDNTDNDSILEDLCNAITEEIESQTGRVFMERAVTERRVWDATNPIRLLYFPIVTDALDVFTIDGDAVATDDYVLYPSSGLIGVSGLSYRRGIAVAIEYVAGYARADLHARVVQLAKDMVKIRFDAWVANSSGVSSMNQGQTSMVPLADWPYAIKNTLKSLKEEANP